MISAFLISFLSLWLLISSPALATEFNKTQLSFQGSSEVTSPIQTQPEDFLLEEKYPQDTTLSFGKDLPPIDMNHFPVSSDTTSYAKILTSCVKKGQRAAKKCSHCAKGVRYSLMCMFKKLGIKNADGSSKYVHCGSGAFAYHGHGSCMEKLGFVNDMNACNTPGVVRVYFGNKTRNPNSARNRKFNDRKCQQTKRNAGRYCGHIEFLGTDQRWHAACSSSLPRDKTSKGSRILKACYIYKGSL